MKAKTATYIEIVAECSTHGQFTVHRKPNRRQDNGSGKKNDGFYDAVKCPKCPWWARIITQKKVEMVKPSAYTPQEQALPLGGTDA